MLLLDFYSLLSSEQISAASRNLGKVDLFDRVTEIVRQEDNLVRTCIFVGA
jgi:hypothetical protein